MHILTALTLEDFKPQARGLLAAGITPEQVAWQADCLFAVSDLPEGGHLNVPKGYGQLATTVACHRDGRRWAYLYEVLWRLHHGEKHLLEDPADPTMRVLQVMAKQVGRDIHKAHAFVRFRETVTDDGVRAFLAWHRPDHRIMRLAAPFFVKRFASQNWGIATPDESCCWDGKTLTWGDGMPACVVPPHDAVEDLWRTYYRHIFNPARIKLKMMKSEMPVRHWATLPETQDIAQMLRDAPKRVEDMLNTAFYSSDESRKRAARVLERQAQTKAP